MKNYRFKYMFKSGRDIEIDREEENIQEAMEKIFKREYLSMWTTDGSPSITINVKEIEFITIKEI